MKAFLLAAGMGTRLRPLTDHTPKCMLPIGGRPMLDLWLDAFSMAGVDEVLVNLHHCPEIVAAHLEARRSGPTVRAVLEPELLGSAGTLRANASWVAGEELFLACHADNLTDFDLTVLVEAHRRGGALATLALFRSDNPSACGIVELDQHGTVIAFTEKPEHPSGNLANAGMYAFDPRAIADIQGPAPRDIGYHLLPGLVGRAKGVTVEGYFRDIGDPASYRAGQAAWAARAKASTGPVQATAPGTAGHAAKSGTL